MGSWKSLLAKSALLIVSLGLSALFIEAAVLIAIGEQAKFPRHVVGTDFGVRVNEPGARYRHKSADGTFWFEINSKGLRADRDYPYEKPEGVVRIVSLGDSFTAGYEVQHEETFSSVLEETLTKAGYRAEVLNAGVSGYSNAEALVYLERELLKYDPDLVLLSFFANDLVDNVRTGLFRVVDGQLVEAADRYVPAGGLGDFLNTNPIFNWLSGYSNAFVFAKEQLTHIVKRQIIAQNQSNVDEANEAAPSAESAEASSESLRPEVELAVAILDRLYATTRERGIPLVIQSIPILAGDGNTELVETFPIEAFDLDREGLYFVGMVEALEPSLGQEPLYNRRSHWHWTPFAHRVSGERIGQLVVARGLLE